MTSDSSGRERWSESAAMGTTVHLCLVDEDPAGEQAAELHGLVAEADAALSRFRPGSDVSRLNASPEAWLPVGSHLVAVAEAAERYRELTDGVFDAVTGAEGKSGLCLRPGGEAQWEARLSAGCSLDLGAIAKGYAADLVRDRAVAGGVLASLGTSSISVAGVPARRAAWRIAIGSPWDELPETLGYLEVPRGSFSVSGMHAQRARGGRVLAGHVRDPRTGTWALTDVCSVGVLSEDGMRSEALSTACLVLGLEPGMALVRRHAAEAVFLTASGRILATPGLVSQLSLRAGVSEHLSRLRVHQSH